LVAEVDLTKCRLCGAYDKPVCVDVCPTTAIQVREEAGSKKIVVTEFLCEDCNECGFRCPDKAIKIKDLTF
jgi:MinD superfamily P-loop ATPase